MAQSIIEEIYEEIKKANSKNDNTAIPHSDEFVKITSAMLGVSPDLIKKIIQVLVRSHRIFPIEIVMEDQLRETPGIVGYVLADLNIIRRLKNLFQRELMYAYNRQNNKNLLVHQIIKEIFPIMKSFNNTPLGENANKAIMLAELENLVEKNFNEYTEDFKENRFRVEVSSANLDKLIEKREKAAQEKTQAAAPEKAKQAVPEKVKPAPQALRAVDTKSYGDLISKKNKYPLNRIINIYGVDFFYKINLRNYQFTYLKQVINDRQISRRTDLMRLREMLRVVRSNVSRDVKLKEYLDDIYDLEKAVVHQLYFSGMEGQS